MTANAHGVLPPDHALAISASPSLIAVRQLISCADVVLALGTEFSSTDYDMYERDSATGFGALGYGVPAAIGAAIASKGTTICLIGDGELQFCLSEHIVAVQEQAHVVFIVWNNQGYGDIERYMRSAGIDSVGVALYTPDFVTIAVAMGLDASRPTSKHALEAALSSANRTGKATLIEIDEQMARSMDL